MPQHFKGKKGKARSRALVEHAMREVHEDTPSTVERANVSGERKESMLRAIALSKARKAGANIPKKGKRPRGSGPFTNADLMKGYKTR